MLHSAPFHTRNCMEFVRFESGSGIYTLIFGSLSLRKMVGWDRLHQCIQGNQEPFSVTTEKPVQLRLYAFFLALLYVLFIVLFYHSVSACYGAGDKGNLHPMVLV